MKTKTISSLIVLLAIATTIASAPSAFAEHSMNAVVESADGSGMSQDCVPDCFLPATVTIGVGGMVEFPNNDTAAHTATAGTPADGPSGVWDSSLIMPGASFTTPALDAGEYPYFCMVHPWMEGLVIVEEESHDDHAMEEADHSDMGGMEMATLTAADIAISVKDGAKSGEKVAIDVTINGEHVNYDIVATHNGETILDESDNHSHTGEGSHTTSALSADASDDNPIDVTVTFQGFGFPDDDKTGPIGLTNTAQAVPEFGTIAAMILVVAIVSIIAITSKSRLSLTPKL